MATLPLDLRDLAGESPQAAADDGLGGGARIGHVHLEVADLDDAERFYGDLLGFEVTARRYPGALFLAAGGYHHHVGVNTWGGPGAPPPPDGAAGLHGFTVELPRQEDLDRVVDRLWAAGVAVDLGHATATTLDPSRNGVVLRARQAA